MPAKVWLKENGSLFGETNATPLNIGSRVFDPKDLKVRKSSIFYGYVLNDGPVTLAYSDQAIDLEILKRNIIENHNDL